MDKKELMMAFLSRIRREKLWTKFLINIFDYQALNDYNYIYRFQDSGSDVIIDIYDNISANHFNRYVFSFSGLEKAYQVYEKDSVFVTVIDVLNSDNNSKNKLIKLAHLFSLNKNDMNDYAKTFLNSEFVKIVGEILK